jgi:hypothetical protein
MPDDDKAGGAGKPNTGKPTAAPKKKRKFCPECDRKLDKEGRCQNRDCKYVGQVPPEDAEGEAPQP